MKTKEYIESKGLQAVYGQISYYGGTWSIYYKRRVSADGSESTGSYSGYGEFPFAEFPDLPVIDYRTNDKVFNKLSANIACIETHSHHTDMYKLMSLADYLQWHVDNGINVIFPSYANSVMVENNNQTSFLTI